MKSKPYFIKIEPSNKCNLRCEGCLHAASRQDLEKNQRLGDMDFDVFKKIIDDLEKYLVKVSLYAMGESLLNKNITKMVEYLTERNIGSVISSNLNYHNDQLTQELVKNKLTHLIVSLDGASEEVYSKYRKGGSFARVVENIKAIQVEKKKQGSKYPLIEVQTIAFDYITQKEVLKIKKLARDLGVEKFTLRENVTPLYDKPDSVKKRCFWLYASPMIHWDGTVQPCCHFYEYKNNNFGKIDQAELSDIWNNEKYLAARKYFKSGKKEGTNLKCHECIFFRAE